MLAMTDRTLRLVVVHGLLVGLCLCEPLQANPNSPARAQQQNRTEAQDVEALLVAGEQGDAEAQFTLGARYESGRESRRMLR